MLIYIFHILLNKFLSVENSSSLLVLLSITIDIIGYVAYNIYGITVIHICYLRNVRIPEQAEGVKKSTR